MCFFEQLIFYICRVTVLPFPHAADLLEYSLLDKIIGTVAGHGDQR
ncbi:hypothetical protein J532_3548, partial [Acinetobacter baumannii 940793]